VANVNTRRYKKNVKWRCLEWAASELQRPLKNSRIIKNIKILSSASDILAKANFTILLPVTSNLV
jgi:hypothetical protein